MQRCFARHFVSISEKFSFGPAFGKDTPLALLSWFSIQTVGLSPPAPFLVEKSRSQRSDLLALASISAPLARQSLDEIVRPWVCAWRPSESERSVRLVARQNGRGIRSEVNNFE